MSESLAALSTVDLFATLKPQPADALLSIIGMHRADPRPQKLDLGVGVYRDADGNTPVMRAVKLAETRLVAEQSSKSYLGPEGDERFTALLAPIALGEGLASSDRVTGVQTPGGTGALRLGAELIARADRDRRVWIGTPTWPNHAPIFHEAGLGVEIHAYFDAERSDIDFAAFIDALGKARSGDVVLVHGCCHNPTGAGFSFAQWEELTGFVLKRGLIPFVDLAYQGLGSGLDEDAAGMRALVAAVPEALVAYSCDKNFALYRERVGALWVASHNTAASAIVRDNMLALARSLWSMPPDHGAAVVRVILGDESLAVDWRAELDAMRERINGLRAALGSTYPVLAPIARQQGLFALLPISREAVGSLRVERGVYMAESGRINVAGLRTETIAPFVEALAPHLTPTERHVPCPIPIIL